MVINRILIVGLGSIGKRHLRLARGLFPNADIRVLRHRANNEVHEYSNGSFFTIEEAIVFSPQMAVIASPAPFHIVVAQALAEAGVHLLIEKPLSASLGGVIQLLEACEKHGVVLLTGYNLRFLPSLSHYRDLLSENIVGKVLSVRCEIGQYLPSWRPNSNYRQGVSAQHKLGGGALLELSHELDYLRWIFGEVQWVKATLSRQSMLEIDVEDTAHITLGFVSALDCHQLIGVVNLDFIRHDTTRFCTAIGEKGSLRWNGLTGEIMFYGAGKKEWELIFSHQHHRDDSYIAEWKNFIECISLHKIPLISGNDGFKVLQIVEAVRHSAKLDGQMVSVENIESKRVCL